MQIQYNQNPYPHAELPGRKQAIPAQID